MNASVRCSADIRPSAHHCRNDQRRHLGRIARSVVRLFSGPTREVIQNSLIVANAYLHEHAQLIRGDILGMANDIAHARPLFDQDRATFRELLTGSAASRNLPGAMLIDKDRNILETAQTGIQQSFTTPAPEVLSNVDEN